MKEAKEPLIIIAGPTACGKTDIAIQLAKKISGEVISADSMQVYKHMDIGTAKPTLEEQSGVPHHLLDILMPDEPFNVVIFQKLAKQAIADIRARGHIPIIAGGSGFYLNALIYDTHFGESSHEEDLLRQQFLQLAQEKGVESLHAQLRKVDADYAKEIHPNNVKRVVRALAFHAVTGETLSSHNRQQKQRPSPYDLFFFILNRERSLLYQRIDLRVDQMLAAGLVQEVEGLLEQGYTSDLVSMQGLGYKEFLPYFAGEISLEKAVAHLKQGTRNFAKRQLTWFRRQNVGQWIDLTHQSTEEALAEILTSYQSRNRR